MLTEQFYKHWSGDKLDSIQCDTRFVDDINDDLQYFIDAETGMCCDDGYTRDELSLYVDDDKLIDEIMKVACHRYGCEMFGDEIRAEHPEQVLQAMMTVYAWIVFSKEMK
ncbi:hypothetical protein PO148_01785 [Limosilactobacillus mucosae]|uniref:Uncharacterized protein n=1 Tax=Limosilactobacillus mucosae TaxID=97478 RepID=A0AAJ1HUZ0_LIMMU|nr:hypothetical protein [Limosilactobacillus mucosae]MDC2829929.1 hypothetical protein [Limosilactobacillus mucosae]MDC2837386.1 hypothetical protein [Limosilactobacillus mucosae]MDC2848733.1 hypothetical protein [Limosilactobacillus mucosae]MDC2853653.1 hypothetical protein [Limosilactobacillus mucosae]